MSEINGIVKEIFRGEIASGRNQGDPFWSITLTNDEKLTTFKEEFIEGLEQNKEYTFTVQAKGKYINIIAPTVPCIQQGDQGKDQGGDMREEAEETPSKPIKVATKRKPPVVTSSVGGERIFKNRISALQAAVQYVVGSQAGTATDDELMEYANQFYRWISE